MSTTPNPPRPEPPFPRPGQRDGKVGGDGPHYSAWLVIRYQAGDTGGRPLPPGTVFWESPDVWTQGSQGTNQPVVGEATQVFTRITNLGMQDATGITVKYWWANPSIAISEATATLIATDTVTVPAGNSLVFQSPVDWVPVNQNNGHECLLVEAYDPLFDPLTDPMHPRNDRHVGQKNEHVITLQAGQNFKFEMDSANFTAAQQNVFVEARRGLIPRNFARRFGTPTMWPAELLDPMLAAPVALNIAAEPVRTVPAGQKSALATTVAAAPIDCLPPPDAAATQRFRPGEVRRVTIAGELPAAAAPGEIYVIRISQRIGQVIVGGYTLYLTAAANIRRG